MPISYVIDPPRNLIRTTATGVLTDEEVLSHKGAMAADPACRPGMLELSDVRSVSQLMVTASGIQAMVAVDAEHGPALSGHRLAIVASKDVVFGMARMYQNMTGDNVSGVGVFRDIPAAAEWLGVEGIE